MTATMQTTIDAGGRVVIPKQFRDELGLRPGEHVDLTVNGVAIVITPVQPEVELVREGRILVAHHRNPEGVVLGTDDVRELIESEREERMRRSL